MRQSLPMISIGLLAQANDFGGRDGHKTHGRRR